MTAVRATTFTHIVQICKSTLHFPRKIYFKFSCKSLPLSVQFHLIPFTYLLILSLVKTELGVYISPRVQTGRVSRNDQELDPRQVLLVPNPSEDERRLRPGEHLEGEDADLGTAEAPVPGGANGSLPQQYDHTDQVQEELLQRAERTDHFVHYHRCRGRQQELQRTGNAELERRASLQYLAALSGEFINFLIHG